MKLFPLFLCIIALTTVIHAQERPKYWPIQIGSRLYMRMELALTEPERIQGLMHRTSLPADGGMLFAFPDSEPRAFWMKNTLIPLDILFVDAKGTVVAIHTMRVERPLRPGEDETLYNATLPAYPSDGKPAQFVIELNANQAKRCGIKVGDTIELRSQDLLKLVK